MSASTLIVHHYPQSPVAEKVRVALGIKNAEWASVEIPRLPPKPKLTALTGGYRRTPVLQIGADVFCDSQCILRELEHRVPGPSLYPAGGTGLVWGLSRWTDGELFRATVAVVLGAGADALAEDFARDRGRLYFGDGFDLQRLARQLPHHLSQLRGQLAWIDERLAAGQAFLLGEEPSLADALAYHMVWFARGRYPGGDALLSGFPSLCRWEERVAAIGHGSARPMSADEALAVARDAPATTAPRADPGDPLGLEPGRAVRVAPAGDGADPWVEGELVQIGTHGVALRRDDPLAGTVTVHFPRVGYRVEPLAA